MRMRLLLKNLLGKMNRSILGQVLVLAGGLAIVAAFVIDHAGLSSGAGSLPFVGTLVCLKLGLFAFWPDLKHLHEERDIFSFVRKPRRPSSMALWDQNDPRVDVSLFSASVPTFVLSAEQRLLDWNPAFELAFGEVGLARHTHVSEWFKHLDNFRRVPKRTEKLYGEGLLPITDRERATFLSERWGRMVFTKIMSPIVDRSSGRIIGWMVVLNINSVNKRQEFFEQLFEAISRDSRRIRYAASVDGVFEGYKGRDELVTAHLADIGQAARVLDFGTGTGGMIKPLLAGAPSRKVTAVDGDVHMLRRAKDKCEDLEPRVRLVRQNLDGLKGLPEARFDAVVVCESLHRVAAPLAALTHIYRSLKPGGVLSLSARLDGVEPLFTHLRTHLETSGRFDQLKHQFNHVLEFERELETSGVHRFPSRDELRTLVLEAGFTIEGETRGLQDGHTLILKARR